MNLEQLSDRINGAVNRAAYSGSLTPYAVQSIELARSNYPVQNLILFCQDMNLTMVMTDMTTEDRFFPNSTLGVHKVLNLLMDRYKIAPKLVYLRSGVHYTPPKSFLQEDLEKMKEGANGKKYVASLSIKTLLAVCEVIHCDLTFKSN